MEKIAIGQLHWSAANYAPLQERALWDGLVGMYEEVSLFSLSLFLVIQQLAADVTKLQQT